jgi:hypothetical protein
MAFSTIGFEGASLTTALTVSTSTPEYPGAPVTVGQRIVADRRFRVFMSRWHFQVLHCW